QPRSPTAWRWRAAESSSRCRAASRSTPSPPTPPPAPTSSPPASSPSPPRPSTSAWTWKAEDMAEAHDGPVVRVQGAATTRTLPDKATLDLRVTELDRDPSEALRTATERADDVASVLRQAGIPDSAWHTSGVRVAEEWRWERNKSVSYGH